MEQYRLTQASQLYSLITQHDSYLQAKLARDSLRDSKAMKTLSVLTILFLPGAFLATVFSTEMFEFESKTQEIYIYFVITVPLTVILMVGWVWWMRKKVTRVDDLEKVSSRVSIGSPGSLDAKKKD